MSHSRRRLLVPTHVTGPSFAPAGVAVGAGVAFAPGPLVQVRPSAATGVGSAWGPVINDHGPRYNDWVRDPGSGLPRTSGPGGDYPDGIVRLPGRAYYVDPFDLGPSGGYARAYDPSKPFGNYLINVEADGPGSVTFDLSPESASTHLGQTQSQAYDDHLHGGAFRNVIVDGGSGTTGDFRWIFWGQMEFANGAIFLKQNADGSAQPHRLLFFGGTRHHFGIEEWRRQFDVIRVKMGIADPGYTIPNTATYQSVEFSPMFKNNFFPTAFRGEGMENIYIIGADIGPCGDDGIFLGGNHVDVIGSVIHEVEDKGVAPDMHHPDVLQSAGGHHVRMIDCTINGHLNIGAEFGNVSNCVFDRVWQGMCGIIGGIVYRTGGWTMPGTTFGLGAPDTRLHGHFYAGFGNGKDHNDGGQQHARQLGDVGWHAVLQDYGDSGATFGGNIFLSSPSGVTFGPNGLLGPSGFATSGLASFLGSPDVPHQQFKSVYSLANDLFAVLNDYGIVLD